MVTDGWIVTQFGQVLRAWLPPDHDPAWSFTDEEQAIYVAVGLINDLKGELEERKEALLRRVDELDEEAE